MSEDATGTPGDLTIWVDTDLPGTQKLWTQEDRRSSLSLPLGERHYRLRVEPRARDFYSFDLWVWTDAPRPLYKGPITWESWHMALAAIARDLWSVSKSS